MAYIHSCGVIHRDLKPDNIMLGVFGETLVVDWGLARTFRKDRSTISDETDEEAISPEANSDFTHAGSILGTPAYMSPEQAEGHHHNLNPSSDIYSLGAILYVLQTGQHAFIAESTLEPRGRATAARDSFRWRVCEPSAFAGDDLWSGHRAALPRVPSPCDRLRASAACRPPR